MISIVSSFGLLDS